MLAKSSRQKRIVAFVDTVDVDHDAKQRERSINPHIHNVPTPETPIQPSSTKRKRSNAEIEEDTGSENHARDTTQAVRRKLPKNGIIRLAVPVSTIPTPTRTPTNSKAGKRRRRDVDLTIDIEGSLLPPTPLTDGPTRRSTRIRERSTGPVTHLPPTPVLPTPEGIRFRNVDHGPLSSTPSRIETDGTPSTPEPLVVDFGIPISSETPTSSTSSRRNVSVGEPVSQLEPEAVVSTPQDDFPSVPKRSDSPLIYQPVDLVPVPERSYVPSKHRRTNSKLLSPTKSVQHDDGDRTPYLASPVLFDMHSHVAGPRILQVEETPAFARRLDFLAEHEKMESQHEGLSLLANAATSPTVQTVSLRREESDVELRLVRPALMELGTQVIHPESSIREERLHATPSVLHVAIPIAPPAPAANRSKDAQLNGLDMTRIMRNVYMGSFVSPN